MIAKKFAFLTIVAGTVLGLDLFTKMLVLAHLPLGAGIPVIPGLFDLTHVQNPGGAFGFLATMGPQARGVIFILVCLVAVAVILWFYMQTPVQQRGLAFGFALIFGGAIGNLVDRLRFGAVIDFIDIYIGDLHWPAFNIADSAITVGVTIFAFHVMFRKMPG
ncbi:MAG TPA: signal peptidase II [Desulfobacterales bacterium]|nr:signal peptidase II [Desulfobacterales bacterium]